MAHAPLPPWISAPRLESQGRFVAAKRLEKTCGSPADICTQCSMSFQIRCPRSGLEQVSCSDQAKFLAWISSLVSPCSFCYHQWYTWIQSSGSAATSQWTSEDITAIVVVVVESLSVSPRSWSTVTPMRIIITILCHFSAFDRKEVLGTRTELDGSLQQRPACSWIDWLSRTPSDLDIDLFYWTLHLGHIVPGQKSIRELPNWRC